MATETQRGRGTTASRSDATRNAIITTAERLFAQYGVHAVSNRQLGEAAGQGNKTVVNYHFGTKAELVRALIIRHTNQIEWRRGRMLLEIDGSAEVRDWVACLVRPITDHMAELGTPSWYGRLSAQVLADPTLCDVLYDEAVTPALRSVLDGLDRCLPELSEQVRWERRQLYRLLVVNTVAERERAMAEGRSVTRPTWSSTGTGLIDVLAAAWAAPATPTDE